LWIELKVATQGFADLLQYAFLVFNDDVSIFGRSRLTNRCSLVCSGSAISVWAMGRETKIVPLEEVQIRLGMKQQASPFLAYRNAGQGLRKAKE
jgi:hypothetical protein